MRRYMIVGLGLLVCLTFAWVGDDSQTAGQDAVTDDASGVESRPVTASAPVELLHALTSARPWLQAWLQAAINASRKLAGKDEEPDTPELKQAAAAMGPAAIFPHGEKIERFPRESHVAQYMEVRPWSWYYAPWHTRQRSVTVPKHRPLFQDARRLRDLLRDKNPEMRAMAAEALATLHQPEDLGLLGRLLDDETAAAPALGYNMSRGHAPLGAWAGGAPSAGDGLDLHRSWRNETVAQCARRALRSMTGKRFNDKAAFEKWWKVNSDGRNCLWYWQQRLERELNEAVILTSRARLYQRPDETWARYRARQQALNSAARAEVHRTIAAELRQLAPEVEAKVRLLTVSDHAGGAPITGSEGQFWPDPPNLRVSSDRLLDLLDRKDLWPDVPWDADNGRGMYNLLAERVGMWASVLFRPAHVPRLRSALEREHGNLWWSGQAGMVIGISRLLPPATEAKLDDPNTRDGVLRQAVHNEPELFVRDYCARELVRVGLPMNASFLKDVAFATRKDDQGNRIGQGILEALAQPHLTSQKRRFLVDLLLDRRFEHFWTRPDTRMGMGMCRSYGFCAISAHAGREVISDSIKNRLTDPAESGKALAELRQIVGQLRREDEPKPESTTLPAATQPATASPTAVQGKLAISEHPNQIGLIANRVIEEDGRVAKIIYYRLARPGIRPPYKESDLVEAGVRTVKYDANGRACRVETSGNLGVMAAQETQWSEDGSLRSISWSDRGGRVSHRNLYRGNMAVTELHYNSDGVIAGIRGEIPPDQDLPRWGKTVDDLACAVLPSAARGPFAGMGLWITARNRGTADRKIVTIGKRSPEFLVEVRRADGTLVQQDPQYVKQQFDRRQRGNANANTVAQTMSAGKAELVAWGRELHHWYADLPPGKYQVTVTCRSGDEFNLVSNTTAFEIVPAQPAIAPPTQSATQARD